MTFTITMDVGTVWAVLGVAGIVAGALTEIVRTRTPRAWWHDLDKRVSILESRMDDREPNEPEPAPTKKAWWKW